MKSKFSKCVHCGRSVYTDGFGDDVISQGYYTVDGWVCEGCYLDDEYGGDEK